MEKRQIGILALAAVMMEPCFAGAMGPISIRDSWTGLYVGGQIGEAWAYQHLRLLLPVGTRIGNVRNNNASFLGGGYVGLNWQINDFLIGVEGDANATDINDYGNCVYQNAGIGNPSPGACFPASYDFNLNSKWQAAARGRLGWIWRSTLFYVAGGVAFTDLKATYTTVAGYSPLGSATYRDNLTGSTAGIGAEFKFNGHWIARAEYRYDNYGNNKHLATNAGGFWNQYVVESYLKDNSFRVGISYLV
jgi:outer membrane immunogenic protein